MTDFTCWNCAEKLVDEGEGFWRCPKCGMSYHTRYSQMGEVDGAERMGVGNAGQNGAAHGKNLGDACGYSEKVL